MLAIIVVMLVFGVIGGVVASSKNRNPLAWGVICFLTGIVGLIILALMGTATGQQPGGAAMISSQVSHDDKRWSVLVDVDPEIKAAASEVAPFGEKWVNRLADKYLAVNDKAYLEAIKDSVLAEAKAAPAEPERGVIGPSNFQRQADGSYKIVGGAYVGQGYKNYDAMVSAYAKVGDRVTKVG